MLLSLMLRNQVCAKMICEKHCGNQGCDVLCGMVEGREREIDSGIESHQEEDLPGTLRRQIYETEER